MNIELHSAVTAHDLPDIYAFIARENPRAAEDVLNAIDETFHQLVCQPQCGVAYPSQNIRLSDVRMLPVHRSPNYLIFYRVELDAVRVLYVVHGARHLPRLFKRESRL